MTPKSYAISTISLQDFVGDFVLNRLKFGPNGINSRTVSRASVVNVVVRLVVRVADGAMFEVNIERAVLLLVILPVEKVDEHLEGVTK